MSVCSAAKKVWLLTVCCLLVTAGCTKAPRELKVQVGDRFPDMAVRDLKNNPQTIVMASGKITILNLWATWCGPCREEMPSLDRLAGLLDDTKFRVVGMSVDQDDHLVREYLIERKIFFENYLDYNMNNTDLLGIRVFPSTFFIAGDGRLLKVVEGWRYWDTMESINEIKSLAATLTSVK